MVRGNAWECAGFGVGEKLLLLMLLLSCGVMARLVIRTNTPPSAPAAAASLNPLIPPILLLACTCPTFSCRASPQRPSLPATAKENSETLKKKNDLSLRIEGCGVKLTVAGGGRFLELIYPGKAVMVIVFTLVAILF